LQHRAYELDPRLNASQDGGPRSAAETAETAKTAETATDGDSPETVPVAVESLATEDIEQRAHTR
jgi:hypothetical protein